MTENNEDIFLKNLENKAKNKEIKKEIKVEEPLVVKESQNTKENIENNSKTQEKIEINKSETNFEKNPINNIKKNNNENEKSEAFNKLKELAKPKTNISQEKVEIKENINNSKIKQNDDFEELKKRLEEAIKKDDKLINYKSNTNPEIFSKESKMQKNLYSEYEDEFEEYIPLKKERNSLIKIDEFDWEKEPSIERPEITDFNIKNSYVEPDPSSKRLDWLKKEINKNENDAAIKIKEERKENNFPWEATQKISAPKREDFIEELSNEKIEMDNTANEIKEEISEFDWEKEDLIDKPLESDFSVLNAVKEEVLGKNKIINHPKWIHKKEGELEKNQKNDENKLMNKNFDKKENKEKIETKKELTKSSDLELKKEKLDEKQNENKEKNNAQEFSKKKLIKEDSYFDKSGVKTPIDIIFEVLEEYGEIDLGKATQISNSNYYTLEKIMKTFEDYGIVDIRYPASLNKKPKIELVKKIESKIRPNPKGELIEEYEIEVDTVPAKVEIINTRDEVRPIYCINMPRVGTYTRKFLEFIKDEIAENIPIEIDEILDPKKSKHLKKKFFEESQIHLKNYFTNIKQESLDILSGIVMHEMYGLGDIELFLGDDMLEEVAINSSKTPITVYHRVHGWLKTNFFPGTEEEISNYSAQIGRKVGREITTLTPILDAHLLSGDRVNATLFPISSEGNTLTIRRFARRPWTLVDFIGSAHTMNTEMAALLWLSMQYELNIIVSGGTASGKTSTLNTLLALVPSYHRIITIEDVREIVLPKFLKWNWIPMVTRSANPEGLGEVTMLDCMVTSLRMRPDRIIVGEIRRKKEAEVMMEAIETGHSIYSTIHANSAYQVLRRLGEAPMSIPPMQIEQIDLIITQFRDRKTNRRRTYEIAEIEQTSTGKGLQINTIYKWNPRGDDWENLNKPNKVLTLLNLHTGMTEGEIQKELNERKKILNWLVKNRINDLNEIGFVMKKYYIDKKEVLSWADKDINKKEIDEMIK